MVGLPLIAIDPGSVSGAYALFLNDGKIVVSDLAVVDSQLDAAALYRLVHDMGVRVAVVEKVGAMPLQGVTSTFNFGYACGAIYGVIAACGIELNYVVPRKWKSSYGLGKDKEQSRALAIRLYPTVVGLDLKRHHGRAEALLLGRWFLSQRSNGNDDT